MAGWPSVVTHRRPPGHWLFLGFEISVSKSWRTGNRYIHTCPSKESLYKIKLKLKRKTARNLTPVPLSHIVDGMNASLRGWSNYFHYANSSNALGQIRTFAEERLRTHLINRHKVKDRGIGRGRFPSQKLYDHYGLYKVPTTAGWKSAHASV